MFCVLDLTVCLVCAIATAGAMFAAWLASLALRDASIADVVWGPMLALAAWAAYLAGEGADRSLLAAVLATAWGLRLAAHIGARNAGHGEDRRYAKLRERARGHFAWRSLWSIFGLQAAIGFVVILPVQSAAADPTPPGVGAVAIVGVAVALGGLVCEAVADLQLRRFLAAGLPGGVMDRGLWRYSRHPNYFGDALFWWGIWLIAVEAGSPAWTAVGPALMTVILVRVTGAALLERTIADRRSDYEAYVRRTSAFVPRPPR